MKIISRRVCLVPKVSSLEKLAIGPRVTDVPKFLATVARMIASDFFRCSQMIAVVLKLPDAASLVSAGYGPALPDRSDRYHTLVGQRYLKRCHAYPALDCKVVILSPSLCRTINLRGIPDYATHVIVGVHVSDGVTDDGDNSASWQIADEARCP